MTTVAPDIPASEAPGERSKAHREARARAFAYVLALQTVDGPGREVVDEIVDAGEVNGWPDVVRLGLFLDVICTRHRDRSPATECGERLLERAGLDGDPVMSALALAVRAEDRALRAPVEADRDLARAVVMLEGHEGPSTEAVSAHIQCCVSADSRDLWELQLRHYDAAERCIDPDEGADGRLAVLLYNRAELQLHWVAALRELGDEHEMRERAALAREALDKADDPVMPAAWREDLTIFRDLLDAMSPPEGGAPRARGPPRASSGATSISPARCARPMSRRHAPTATARSRRSTPDPATGSTCSRSRSPPSSRRRTAATGAQGCAGAGSSSGAAGISGSPRWPRWSR